MFTSQMPWILYFHLQKSNVYFLRCSYGFFYSYSTQLFLRIGSETDRVYHLSGTAPFDVVCVRDSGLTWPAASRRQRRAPAVPWAPPTRPCTAPTQWSLGQSDRWRCGGWCCGEAAWGWGAAAAGRSAPYLQNSRNRRIRVKWNRARWGTGACSFLSLLLL